MTICWKCAHPHAIQDVYEFVSSSDLEKCSIASLAHQWMLCSEWVPSEWVQTADKNITLSAIWALILTAPIHCRGSIAEHVMQCWISPNVFRQNKQTHYCVILDSLRVSLRVWDDLLIEKQRSRCFQLIQYIVKSNKLRVFLKKAIMHFSLLMKPHKL